MVSVPGGLYCIDHGVMDCELPFCWRCGNHLMDAFDRCAAPTCRATCTPEALAIVAEVKALWPDRPAPLEAITVALGYRLLPPTMSSPPPSLEPGAAAEGSPRRPSGAMGDARGFYNR
jgi:hypothetical protein